MEDINQKLNTLARNIIDIHGGFSNLITWDEYIKAHQVCLETVAFIKQNKETSSNDWLVLRKLMEEILKLNIECEVEIKSYKREKFSKLRKQIKKELECIPYIKEKETEIKTVDYWIKSLKILKLRNSYLSKEYYQSSYELYQDIRKIIIKKNQPDYKRIYVGKVINELDKKENKSKLPANINLNIEDYELSQLVKLIRNNPDFNYELMPFKYENALINHRLETGSWVNKLLLLVKKG